MSLPKPYYQDSAVTLYHGDCRQIVPLLERFDLLLTDPPYGTGGRRRASAGQGKATNGSVVKEDWDDGLVDWVELARPAPMFVFWPSGRAQHLLNAATIWGYAKHRQLYWKKLDPMPQPANRTPYSVEPIWVFSQDGISLEGPDWFEDSTPRLNRDSDATGHPYQKPIGVLHWLLSLTDAQTVLDPFAGSGTTGRACKDLGRKCVMIEREERYCEIAARRMGQEVLAL